MDYERYNIQEDDRKPALNHRKELQDIRNAWYEGNEQYQLKSDQEQARELKGNGVNQY